jgi:methylenetetrahydrofolate reductase (NADPH)
MVESELIERNININTKSVDIFTLPNSMKVTDHIKQSKGKTLFSFEILPPLKGQHVQEIFKAIDPLMEFNPSFIDVTYHREEYYYKTHQNGLLERKVIRKRPGTVGICAAIQNKYKIDAIPHVLCGGFTIEDTENMLIDLNFLEIDNVMALRGDPTKSETYFIPNENGHHYAGQLVKQIQQLNQGIYQDDSVEIKSKTDFCIGVAAYPEKHNEAPSFEEDLLKLKEKVAHGADYIVTQMFFDNQKYFDFVAKCRAHGIDIPIIPGIKPLTSAKQMSIIPQRFHLDLPNDLIKEIQKCTSSQAVQELGIAWATHQSKELLEKGVPVIHYYSMGNGLSIQKIAKEVY